LQTNDSKYLIKQPTGGAGSDVTAITFVA
jgi:hypothetical protein